MSVSRIRFYLFVAIVLIATTAIISTSEVQSFMLQAVTPSPLPLPTSSPIPTPSPSPSPSPTPSLEERLDVLESQVADLKEDTNISHFKEIADIVQVVITVVAVVVGGIWSYWLFVKNRQKYPRAGIAHRIMHKHIGNDKLLLHVSVIISNLGDVLLSLVALETRIQQVLSLPDEVLEAIGKGQNPVSEGETEVAWPLIDSQKLRMERGECEIEPGESQEIHHDFIFDADVEVIEVYTYLINEQKRDREIAWEITTLYELSETEKAFSHMRRSKSNDQEAGRKTKKAKT